MKMFMEYYNLKKRKNILKIIILIILVLILSILGFFYRSKLFLTDHKNLTNDLDKKNESKTLEKLLEQIKSDLQIMKPTASENKAYDKLSTNSDEIISICDNLLKNLENTKKEKEIECIFDKSFNFFETKANNKEELGSVNARISKNIANMIKIYKICLEEFLKIKDTVERKEVSHHRGVPTTSDNTFQSDFSQEDLDKGRDYLLSYAHILKCFTEDIPNIKQEMQMNESQQRKFLDLENKIWEYMKNLRQVTLTERSASIPRIFASIIRNNPSS